MKKQIIRGIKARKKLQKGVNELADTVVTTLGPRGKNVAMGIRLGIPRVVHDGVTVAKSIILEDPFEDMGAQLVRQASEKTNDKAGDGTTTSCLLAQSIINEGMEITNKEVGDLTKKINPMKLRGQLEVALDKVVGEVNKLAIKVKTKDQKENVATISSQDPVLGSLVAEAFDKVGDDGVITAEDGTGMETELVCTEGLEFDKGVLSPYFLTDEVKNTVELKDVHILVTDLDILRIDEMLGFFDSFIEKNKKILIIANKIGEKALAALVMNKEHGALYPIAVQAPAFGKYRKPMLEDIATVVGATLISKETGKDVSDITLADLGYAKVVKSTLSKTTIVGGNGDKKKIDARIKRIRNMLKESPTEVENAQLNNRLSKLTNGVAVIRVGGATEAEILEKKLRVEDAIHATKAAVEDGIVAGGGITLMEARKVLKDSALDGENILYKALECPLTRVLENAGVNVDRIKSELKNKPIGVGYNIVSDEFVDMVSAGVIDPVKVTINALENAVSVAITVLTTEALVADIEEDKKDE